jgi:hypothetical protein
LSLTVKEELYFVDEITKKTKPVEMVGMDKIGKKISSLEKLNIVSLEGAMVSTIELNIAEKTPSNFFSIFPHQSFKIFKN